MPRRPLVACDLLDPRPEGAAAERPISGAVNIPLTELAGRVHELPARDVVVTVVGPPELAGQAVEWLNANGRRGVVSSEFAYADGLAPAEVGCLWRPNAFLEEMLPQLEPGRALDVACGTGRDAVFAASLGWHVTAVDVLPDALQLGAGLARHCAPAIVPVDWRVADLERGAPPTFEHPFDLIMCFRYLHRPLFELFAQWLCPGGNLICETFTATHRERYGRPAADAHLLQTDELPTLLAGLTIRHCSEGWRESARDWKSTARPVHTSRCWAVKPE